MQEIKYISTGWSRETKYIWKIIQGSCGTILASSLGVRDGEREENRVPPHDNGVPVNHGGAGHNHDYNHDGFLPTKSTHHDVMMIKGRNMTVPYSRHLYIIRHVDNESKSISFYKTLTCVLLCIHVIHQFNQSNWNTLALFLDDNDSGGNNW